MMSACSLVGGGDDDDVFRTDTATVTGQYQSPDNRPGDVDAFAREPFVVRFRAPKTGELSRSSTDMTTRDKCGCLTLQPAIKEFVLIPQHTAPANTTKELDALYDVLQDVRKMWRTEVRADLQSEHQRVSTPSCFSSCEQDVMLLGDFNADCAYLSKKNREKLQLITDKNLHWLIAHKTDTTVRASTSCSYDR